MGNHAKSAKSNTQNDPSRSIVSFAFEVLKPNAASLTPKLRKALEVWKKNAYKMWCESLIEHILSLIDGVIEYCENPYVKKDECVEMLQKTLRKINEIVHEFFYNVCNDYELIKKVVKEASKRGSNFVLAVYGVSKSLLSRFKKVIDILGPYEDKFGEWFRALSKNQLIELAYEIEKYPENVRECLLKHLSVMELPGETKSLREFLRQKLLELKSICQHSNV